MAARKQARNSASRSNKSRTSATRRSVSARQHPADCQCPEHRGRRRATSSSTRSKRSASARSKKSPPRSSTQSSASSRSRSTGARSTRSTSTARGRSSAGHILTDHDEIRRWAEERDAQPACVRGTGSNTGPSDIGMIRLDFPGYTGADSLSPVTWDDWFEVFDDRGLGLLVQDKTAGGQRSNFNKLVSREAANAGSNRRRSSARTSSRRAA